MAVPVVNIMLENVTRLLMRDIGWVEVQPNSVRVVSTLYRKQIPGSEETEYAGWGYLAIEYVEIGATTISYTSPDNIIAVDVPQPIEEPPVEPEGE